MLSIGAQLYRESDRDLVTVQLEDFRRSGFTAWAIGQAAAQPLLTTMPVDRMFHLQAFTFTVTAGAAAARLRSVRLVYTPTGGGTPFVVVALGGDALATTLQEYAGTVITNILLPRGGTLQVDMTRSDTTAAGTAEAQVYGFVIPPGNIARGS